MLNDLFFVLGVGAPILAAIFAVALIGAIGRKDAGTEQMQRIAALIRKGAMAFLRVEYSVLAIFVAVMFVILALFLPHNGVPTAISFVIGALLSALAACGPSDNDPGPGGVTVGEARALDEAAAMIDERQTPAEVLAEDPAADPTAEPTIAPDLEREDE